MKTSTFVVLAILDGWGIAPDGKSNAITRADTPHMDRFIREYPAMTLYACGNEVGLSFGEMGNSEVGHMNIGAGRIYYQTFPRINKAIQDKSFFRIPAFLQAASHVKEHESALHLIGLVSPGNVHASLDHCFALLDFAKKQKIKKVFLHAILDGRDTGFDSGKEFVEKLQQKIKDVGIGKIASLSGRFWAMDRENRWERIEKAYRAIAEGVADAYAADPIDAILESYKKKVYDEEFVPTVIGEEGKPAGSVQPEDAVIFFNFRADRARELTHAFVLPSFPKFQRTYLKGLPFVTMTEYEKELPVLAAFPPTIVHNTLAEAVSKAGLEQFHVAETEKYAHVTFFLNGAIEEPFEGEDRTIIPSPKVASYDKAPEMSAPKITKEVIKAIEKKAYDLICVNYANADMVGHTGDIPATIQGCEAIDKGLGEVATHVLAHDGVLLITADHGNAEEMENLVSGKKDKEHSTNPVPLLIIGNAYRGHAAPHGDAPDGDLSLMHPVGMLADVAPTVLKILGVPIPKEMTGRPLL